MSKINFMIILFVICAYSSFAESLPKYRMVDLGLFGTDESQALAVNENGQVAGTFREGGNNFIFFWDEFNGLKIIELPQDSWCNNLKLNNLGQIAGAIWSESFQIIFFWDAGLGFWELEKTLNNTGLVATINDKGQILGQINDQIFLWDHGKKINLTVQFKEQIQGNWSSFQAGSLNHHGHVALCAYKQQSKENDNWGTRSFLWNGDSFEMIMAERSWETSTTNPISLDDSGNMIVTLYPRKGGGCNQYYINPSKYIIAFSENCFHIKNGLPLVLGCLQGQLKQDKRGRSYFSKGIEIIKLLKEEYPYFNVYNSASIHDQNAQGYVVGRIGTMYPGNGHAFLAIPEQKEDEGT